MAENKRIIFIVNPISGTSGKNFVLKLIDEYLDKTVYDYDVVKTEYVGHATEIAHSASERNVDVVCAIGGDGTVNEVASGLIHTQTALAIIPSGSGNGLARHLHIPTDPFSAIKIINHGLVQAMDYGLVNGRPFFLHLWGGVRCFHFATIRRVGQARACVVHRKRAQQQPKIPSRNLRDRHY